MLMTVEKIHALLNEHEAKKTSGCIDTFSVKFISNRLVILPQPDNSEKEVCVFLEPDLQQTLQIFFSDVDSIVCDSYDYTTLKSLLNAHGTLERMAHQNREL